MIFNLIFFLTKLQLISDINSYLKDNISKTDIIISDPLEYNKTTLIIYEEIHSHLNNLNLNGIQTNLNGGSLRIVNPFLKYYINNTIFYNNSALKGGSIYYDTIFPLFIINCTFKNNSAIENGGSIFINCLYSNNYNINNCFFLRNY